MKPGDRIIMKVGGMPHGVLQTRRKTSWDGMGGTITDCTDRYQNITFDNGETWWTAPDQFTVDDTLDGFTPV